MRNITNSSSVGNPGGALAVQKSSALRATRIPKKLPKGKAGLALAGLAAAGGIGMGIARTRKPKTLEARIKRAVNKNPQLKRATSMATSMFK